ncbi:MAG TPA: sigma-70 family RNA polymerase sigma factor [Myxococcales bacterium]|nr:sigma-70 family RNA polymerase sigma factor [Myxococcales bacterium]
MCILSAEASSVMIDARIEALYKSHGHIIYRRCLSLLNNEDEAFDALQEVFVRILRSNPDWDDERPIMAWVNRVTTNLCFNRIRARRYRRHLSYDEVSGVTQCTPVEVIHRLYEQRDLVRRLLIGCDERTRHVVVGYFFDDMGVDHIGQELSVSVPTVRRILKRFLQGARKKMKNAEAKLTHGRATEVKR